MEVRVRERLIGALVLVAIVVLVVPAILKGRDPAPAAPTETAPTRQVEVPIGIATAIPEEQILVPEPARSDAAPAEQPRRDSLPPQSPTPKPKPASVATEPPANTTSASASAPVPVSAPAAPTSAWAVQLGAFSNQAKAEQLVAELRNRRYAAFVLEYRAGGQVLYRVRVGPEQDRARAEEIAARLAKDGFEPVVARHP